MAYTKQEFKSGAKLYAAQLNAMDAQIATNEEETMRLSEEIDALGEAVGGLLGESNEVTGTFVTVGMTKGVEANIKTAADMVVHTNKNLFDVGRSIYDYSSQNGLVSVDKDKQRITITALAWSEGRAVRDTLIPIKTGDTIALMYVSDGRSEEELIPIVQGMCVLKDANGNILTTGVSNASYVESYNAFCVEMGRRETFTIENEAAAFIQFGVRIRTTSTSEHLNTQFELGMQFELAKVATEYEAGKLEKLPVYNGTVKTYAYEGVNHYWSDGGQDLTVTWNDDYVDTTGIIARNADVLPMVKAAARYGANKNGIYNAEKQLAILATTDLHKDTTRFVSAIEYMDGIPQIDFGVALGDLQKSHYSDNDGTWFTNAVNAAGKKMYPLIGNHDAGNSASVATAATKQQQFNKFFAPVLSKLSLTGLTKTYYSVDTEYGVTMIVLDSYDVPDTMLDDSTFAVSRKEIGYSQAQVDWLISTLAAVPADNHVLVAVHNTLDPATMVEGPWTQEGHMNSDHGSDTGDYPDMIPEIIDAWQNGTTLSKTYTPKKSDAQPTLTVYADFTSRGKGVFAGFLRGHTHRDYIGKMTSYPTQNIYCLSATAHDSWQNANSDLPRVDDERTEDCITVVVVDKVVRKVKLVRIGSSITFDMVRRDMIAIPY